MLIVYLRIGLVLAAALLVACRGGDNGIGGAAAKTTTQLAAEEIDQNTSDTAVPIEINDLPISDADTTDRNAPAPI